MTVRTQMTPEIKAVVQAAVALLERVDSITTEDFSKGGERKQREALRVALTELGAIQ